MTQEIYRLLDLADQFMKVASGVVTNEQIDRVLTRDEREDMIAGTQRLDVIHAEIEKLEAQQKQDTARLQELDQENAQKALRIVDIFTSAAIRLKGEDSLFIFLPAEARNLETAKSYESNRAYNLARLCRRSVEY